MDSDVVESSPIFYKRKWVLILGGSVVLLGLFAAFLGTLYSKEPTLAGQAKSVQKEQLTLTGQASSVQKEASNPSVKHTSISTNAGISKRKAPIMSTKWFKIAVVSFVTFALVACVACLILYFTLLKKPPVVEELEDAGQAGGLLEEEKPSSVLTVLKWCAIIIGSIVVLVGITWACLRFNGKFLEFTPPRDEKINTPEAELMAKWHDLQRKILEAKFDPCNIGDGKNLSNFPFDNVSTQCPTVRINRIPHYSPIEANIAMVIGRCKVEDAIILPNNNGLPFDGWSFRNLCEQHLDGEQLLLYENFDDILKEAEVVFQMVERRVTDMLSVKQRTEDEERRALEKQPTEDEERRASDQSDENDKPKEDEDEDEDDYESDEQKEDAQLMVYLES